MPKRAALHLWTLNAVQMNNPSRQISDKCTNFIYEATVFTIPSNAQNSNVIYRHLFLISKNVLKILDH